MAAAAAAVVVLPTPPGPHATTISLRREQAVERRRGRSALAPGVAPGHHDASSSPRDTATWRMRAQPVEPGEEERQVHMRDGGVDAGAQALEVLGAGAAQGDRQAGRVEHGRGVVAGRAS